MLIQYLPRGEKPRLKTFTTIIQHINPARRNYLQTVHAPDIVQAEDIAVTALCERYAHLNEDRDTIQVIAIIHGSPAIELTAYCSEK